MVDTGWSIITCDFLVKFVPVWYLFLIYHVSLQLRSNVIVVYDGVYSFERRRTVFSTDPFVQKVANEAWVVKEGMFILQDSSFALSFHY